MKKVFVLLALCACMLPAAPAKAEQRIDPRLISNYNFLGDLQLQAPAPALFERLREGCGALPNVDMQQNTACRSIVTGLSVLAMFVQSQTELLLTVQTKCDDVCPASVNEASRILRENKASLLKETRLLVRLFPQLPAVLLPSI